MAFSRRQMAFNRRQTAFSRRQDEDFSKVHLSKTRLPKRKPLPKGIPTRGIPLRRMSVDLTSEFSRSAILSVPRDAIPEYLESLVREYGKPAVQSAVMYQYDIYQLSQGPAQGWLKAALRYLEEHR